MSDIFVIFIKVIDSLVAILTLSVRTLLRTRLTPTRVPGAAAGAGVATATPTVADPRVALGEGMTSNNPTGHPAGAGETPTQPRGRTPTSGVLVPKPMCKDKTTGLAGLTTQTIVPGRPGSCQTPIQNLWTGMRTHH